MPFVQVAESTSLEEDTQKSTHCLAGKPSNLTGLLSKYDTQMRVIPPRILGPYINLYTAPNLV